MQKNNYNLKNEEHLLSTFIMRNKNFENACMSGDLNAIMNIVNEEAKLKSERDGRPNTKGDKKLVADIQMKIARSYSKINKQLGINIMFLVSNSSLKGIGLGTI